MYVGKEGERQSSLFLQDTWGVDLFFADSFFQYRPKQKQDKARI